MIINRVSLKWMKVAAAVPKLVFTGYVAFCIVLLLRCTLVIRYVNLFRDWGFMSARYKSLHVTDSQ